MSRYLVFLLLIFASATAWAESVDGGVPPPTVLPLTFHEEAQAPAAGPATLNVGLPPTLPLDTAFELRAWVPSNVLATTASLWRSGNSTCTDTGEPKVRLETRLTQAADDGPGQLLAVSIPVLHQPWWTYCVSFTFWRLEESTQVTAIQLAALVDRLRLSQTSKGEVKSEDIAAAASESDLLMRCELGPNESSQSWEDCYACERARLRASERIQANRNLLQTLQSAVEIRSKVGALRAHASELDAEVSLLIPAYEDLLRLYGRDTGMASPGVPPPTPEDLRLRREMLEGEAVTIKSLEDRLSSPIHTNVDLSALGASPSQPQAVASKETVFVASAKSVRKELFTKLLATLKDHTAHLDSNRARLSEQAAGAERQKRELDETVKNGVNLGDQLRAQKGQLVQKVIERLTTVVALEAARDKAKQDRDAATQESPIDKKKVAQLERELAAAEEALRRAQPQQVRLELVRLEHDLGPIQENVAKNLAQAATDSLAATVRATALQKKVDQIDEELKRTELVAKAVADLQKSCITYEERFQQMAASLRTDTIRTTRLRASSRGVGAGDHVDRAYGFFSTDVGMGAAYSGRGKGSFLPVTFLQVSMSFAQIDFNNGLGSVSPPKGTGFLRSLLWQLGQRFTVSLGLALNLRPVRTSEGQVEGLFGTSSLMGTAGAGLRLSEYVKVNGGMLIGTVQQPVPGAGSDVHLMPYFGISLDFPVYRAVGRALQPAMGKDFETIVKDIKER